MPVLVRHANRDHAKTVLVDWMIGNRCNYACSYCPAALHDGTLGWQDPELMRGMFRQLDAHYRKGMGLRVWLQFTGGEPTMHPEIRGLLRDASAIGHKVSLISNASRTLRFWDEIVGYLDAAILTYHGEAVEHAHFLRVAARLASAMPTHVNITLPPDRFDTMLDAAQDIAARLPDVSVSLKPLRVNFGDMLYPYTEEQMSRMSRELSSIDHDAELVPRSIMIREFADGAYDLRKPNELIVSGQNRWRGLICSAGLESLRIDGAGNITRAVCGAGGPIGRLGARVDLPTSPVRCTRDACACAADILTTKRRLAPPAE